MIESAAKNVATYSNVKIEEVRAQLPTTEQIKACLNWSRKNTYKARKKLNEYSGTSDSKRRWRKKHRLITECQSCRVKAVFKNGT